MTGGCHCPDHDAIVEQLQEIGQVIHDVELSIVKTLVAALTASTTLLGYLVVV